MKLTKYEHSCVVLEKNGQTLVIDPGELSNSFVAPENCVGVVVTHEHFDHLDQQKLKIVLEKNPEAKIYVNKSIANQLEDSLKASVVTVVANEGIAVGNFKLEFVGGRHVQVRPEVPACENTGVVVDGLFYHPGDSHFVPNQSVKWLAIPLNAPWSRVSETNDFVKSVKPQQVLPIHDGLLTQVGLATYETHVNASCESIGAAYHSLNVGEQIELEN